ncbi:MAG: SMP-30/gluconolactonase/LRE family protein [Opitutaceae bacterium]|nr:SMP-30/gluconolactonase/LRE family protein [Opitutaceae bacterium]
MNLLPRLLLVLSCLASSGLAVELKVVPGWPVLPEGEILGQVSGVGVDSRGDVFVFHRGTPRPPGTDPAKAGPIQDADIVRFDGRTGKLAARWGAGRFLYPHGLFVDSRDHVWVTDIAYHQVFEFDRDGRLLRQWGEAGTVGADAAHFNMPTDVAVAPDGAFYVSDGYGNSRVVQFSADGKFLRQWGRRGTGPGEFNTPHGVALDAEGRVYVADRENDRLQVFTPDGEFLAQWRSPAIGRPFGIRIGRDGLVYVTDGGEPPKIMNRSKLLVLDRTGALLASIGRFGNQDGQFMLAHDLAVSAEGAVFVGDILGRRVQQFRRP